MGKEKFDYVCHFCERKMIRVSAREIMTHFLECLEAAEVRAEAADRRAEAEEAARQQQEPEGLEELYRRLVAQEVPAAEVAHRAAIAEAARQAAIAEAARQTAIAEAARQAAVAEAARQAAELLDAAARQAGSAERPARSDHSDA